MSETLVAIVGGTTYDLSDLVNYTHMRTSGFGMAPVRRLTQRGPMQHGISDVGFRLEPRLVQLVILIDELTQATYWARRDALLRIFRPRDDAILLRHTVGAQVRQIDCHYSGQLDLGSEGRMGYAHRVGVELVCPDPSWYDPTLQSAAWSLSVVSNLVFPATFPIVFGLAYVGSLSITYSGSWLTYPTIQLLGPFAGVVITHQQTGDTLALDYTIPAGDVVTIDCAYGVKTVVDNHGTNLIEHLSDDSDLATFHLAPAPDVAGGVNDLVLTGYGTGAGSGAQVSWYNRYVGI